MKTLTVFAFIFLHFSSSAFAQTPGGPVVWQVNKFDIAVTLLQPERTLGGVATINATNVGGSDGRTLTVRLNPKAKVKSVSLAGAEGVFRVSPEPRGDLQKVEVTLPSAAPPGSSVTLTVNYSLPVESNSGLAAINPINSQFLPLSFWYPMPNTPFTVRGGDTAPFHLSVNAPGVISSGIENAATGATTFDQSLSAQPFFVQGDWERVEGVGDAKGVTAFVARGVSPDEKKQAEILVAYAAATRTYLASLLGSAPAVPLRLVSVKRGAGFGDGGTILVEDAVFRRGKLDAATALSVAEGITRTWLGGQTPIRGEGNGVLHDGLVRFVATLVLEKQFGREAANSELLRDRLAYSSVAKRDGPLATSNQLDSTYFASVPNRGAIVWRLIDRKLGRDAFVAALRTALESGKTNSTGLTLAAFRAMLTERGGGGLKALVDQQLDQIVDTDLMVGLPTQRGADWVSALRNLGSIDVSVPVVATTDRGEQVTAEATVPAKNFGEVVFRTTGRIVRVEVDPEKLYPQLDFANDSVPHGRDLADALAAASLQLGAQDFGKAEATAREIVGTAPRFLEARIILARAMLGQNKLDEAEKTFRAVLDEPLPTAASMAWADLGLGEISLKRGQATEAVKRFNEAVRAGGDYASSLAARAARIKAEAAANVAPPIDESVRTFLSQFGQAIVGGKKADLESRILSGELVRFVNASIGTEAWDTRVLRTEQLNANLIEADVSIRANKLGKEGTGTAVFLLTRTPSGLKLAGIELFEVQ